MKNSLANIDERQKNILDLLQQQKQMTTLELSESLKVSISTIRRDLNLLEEKMRSSERMVIVLIIIRTILTSINLDQND